MTRKDIIQIFEKHEIAITYGLSNIKSTQYEVIADELLELINKNDCIADVINPVCRKSSCCYNDHLKHICTNLDHAKICGSRQNDL